MNEMLTKLNPKIQNITDARGGFGSLAPEDLEHALAGRVSGKRLPRGAYSLGKVIHCDDSPRELFLELVTAAAKRINPPLAARGTPYIKTLAEMAVADVLDAQLCPVCNGRGVVYKTIERPEDAKHVNSDGLLVVDCDKCTDGRVKMTDHERADIMGDLIHSEVTARDWLHRYSWDYSAVLSIVVEWSSMVDRHLHARLQE